MRAVFIFLFMTISILGYSQNDSLQTEGVKQYKKRVLESVELDFLTSYYTQDGANASVTGGIGSEELNNFATNISVAIPLNDDDVLSFDGTISAYTSASSSNLNPFTGASSGASDDDDDDDYRPSVTTGPVTGSPWVASSGASQGDVWISGALNYSHSSDDRNTILSAHTSIAKEFDYSSFGFGGGVTKLFNKKNTEVTFSSSIYLDKWKPEYPTEIKEYSNYDGNLDGGFFNGVDILDQNGNVIDKNGIVTWRPFNTSLINDEKRNTYSASLSFSQILGRNLQFSIFVDAVWQEGWLSNPMQRVYFGDRANYYIGNGSSIPDYTSPTNTDVFQLADDIERLPGTRLKIPVGTRLNYYISERFVLRTYYRYYNDDWGIDSHTAQVELPVKLTNTLTLTPSYRYYNQTAAYYFAPYEEHVITDTYYTSDYDLSAFESSQVSIGLTYTDIFTKFIGLKSLDLNYGYYQRNTGLNAQIITLGAKFIID